MTSKPQLVYHQLDEPFFPNPYGENSGISALHDIYPGRPLPVSDNFNRYSIQPEDPEAARRTFLNNKKETQAYAKFLIERTIADGGGDKKKVITHAIDDPSSVINDPQLQHATMQSPLTINEGQPIPEPPFNLSVEEINAEARGKQIEGNARSEGLADSPWVPAEKPFANQSISGEKIIENFQNEKNSDTSIDPFLSHLFVAVILILLIIALCVLLRK